MRLIGMLDSPYVRRVAVCLEHLLIPFEHESVSVFSTFEQFRRINPVVKAPTLIGDNGIAMMDSTLILQFAEAELAGGRTLWTSRRRNLANEFRVVSLAMAACDKSAQLIYDRNLRPPEAQYAPWQERVTGQLHAAYAALEQELHTHPLLFERDGHGPIATAIAWQFSYSMLAAELPATSYPLLVKHSERMEKTPQFSKYPPAGPGVPGLSV